MSKYSRVDHYRSKDVPIVRIESSYYILVWLNATIHVLLQYSMKQKKKLPKKEVRRRVPSLSLPVFMSTVVNTVPLYSTTLSG